MPNRMSTYFTSTDLAYLYMQKGQTDAKYIFVDLNVQDPFVTDSTDTVIYDTKVVVQSLWRLLTTEEGEIPNFRDYGLGIKKFVQYPMTEDTVNYIFNYVKDKVAKYEARADIINAEVDANPLTQELKMTFLIRVKSTGENIKLPTWVVQVGAPV